MRARKGHLSKSNRSNRKERMDPIVRSQYPMPPRLRTVEIVSRFTVHLTFADGVERKIDLEPYLHGPLFDPIRQDPSLFASVQIDEVGDTICWPNGADIAPETLYYPGDPPWAAKAIPAVVPRRAAFRKPVKQRPAGRKAKTRA
jgi:hypothetical protein